MRVVAKLLAVSVAVALCGCAGVGAVGTVASVTGSVISTTAEVAGDVIGAAARTVTGSSSHDSK
jgi:hypothetical protein